MRKTRVTDDGIYGFFEQYRYLSNFEIGTVKPVYANLEFPTVEHAYQAAKSDDYLIRETFLHFSPSQARREGQKIRKRGDWNGYRLVVMENLVAQKFQCPRLWQALIETNPKHLEETNDWGDRFWGVCQGEGENHLGKILMQIRATQPIQVKPLQAKPLTGFSGQTIFAWGK